MLSKVESVSNVHNGCEWVDEGKVRKSEGSGRYGSRIIAYIHCDFGRNRGHVKKACGSEMRSIRYV